MGAGLTPTGAPGRRRGARSARSGFSRTLGADPGRLHVAAHSHHPWPDVTFDGQQQAWLDAARLLDDKWEHVFGAVLPETQRWIAERLRLPDPATVAVAPNTHALLVRLLSCLEPPVRILTTDGEFVSFERQVRRLAEDGLADVRRVPVHPAGTLTDRLVEAAAAGFYDLLWCSQVLYATGVAIDDLDAVVGAATADALVVIDGYHGFMALPTDLSRIADRAFYLSGGYKYAMAGEGVCFAHCPPGWCPRPRDTGWFADFSSVADAPGARVPYPADGRRLMGATFDPSGLYRFNAAQRWLSESGWTVDAIHRHVVGLQRRLLGGLAGRSGLVSPEDLVAGPPQDDPHGHVLAFRHRRAADVSATLARRGVVVDHRRGHVRLGLGLYHDPADVDELLGRMER